MYYTCICNVQFLAIIIISQIDFWPVCQYPLPSFHAPITSTNAWKRMTRLGCMYYNIVLPTKCEWQAIVIPTYTDKDCRNSDTINSHYNTPLQTRTSSDACPHKRLLIILLHFCQFLSHTVLFLATLLHHGIIARAGQWEMTTITHHIIL